MSGFSNSIISVCVSIGFLYLSESQVTVSNLNGTGTFPCGYSTRLECAIPAYEGGMNWKLDGTIIAQCAFGSCTALGALPSGDIFTYDESAGKFYLDIGITYADNETVYQCNDGLTPDQTTVNIQVPPSYDAFTTDITERNTSITVEAGCFYPSDAGRMDVYCVNRDGTEELVKAAVLLTPTTTGCSGDCAGPNIYTATGSITIDSSNTGGNSSYRFKVYHNDFKQYAISNDSTAIYDCGISKFPSTSATTTRTSTTSKSTTYPPSYTNSFTTSSTTSTSTSTPTTTTTTSPTSTSTTKSQVTVSNLNGTGTFLCGFSTRLECVIPDYLGGMTWKLDGTIVAQCAFGSCTALGALPSGDSFTADEASGKFNLDIGITHADNGTMYQCNDGEFQDQTTVNIQVPPSYDAFTTDIIETATSITVEAGCFYPSNAGRMDVYCVNRDGTEELVKAAVTLTPTTTGCSGDCAGPNIYTAAGNITLNSSNVGGNSRYRFKLYHNEFKQYAILNDSTAIYDCGISKYTSTSATTTRTSSTSKSTTYPRSTTSFFTNSSTTSTSTSTPTTITTTSPTSSSTTITYATSTMDNDVIITITTSIIGGCVILICLVAVIALLYRRVGCNGKFTLA